MRISKTNCKRYAQTTIQTTANHSYRQHFEISNIRMQALFYITPISCFNKWILNKQKYHIDIL